MKTNNKEEVKHKLKGGLEALDIISLKILQLKYDQGNSEYYTLSAEEIEKIIEEKRAKLFKLYSELNEPA